MTEKLNLEQGLKRIFELGSLKFKPVLVLIDGHANCGKTFIRKKLASLAYEKGYSSYGGMIGKNITSYLENRKDLDFLFLEDYLSTNPRETILKEVFNKKVDIAVLINNPKITGENFRLNCEIEQYDLFIENPDSQIKRKP